MTEHPCFGVHLIVEQITKGQVKETAAKSHKHIYGRMGLLKEIVKRYDVNTKDVPLDTVLSYALSGFKHPKEDVRAISYIMVFEIYKNIGKVLRSYIGNLQKNQLDILEQGFQSIDQGADITANEEDVKILMKQSATQAEKTFGKRKDSGRIKSTRQSNREKHGTTADDPNEVELSWQFCKKTGFTEQTLDLHYYDQCLMLYKCFACDQIVEIGDLNNHLINEWEKKDEFYQCVKWKQAVYKAGAEEHDAEGWRVLKSKKTHIRCPLCKTDWEPGGELGLLAHIMEKGCKNNPRNSTQLYQNTAQDQAKATTSISAVQGAFQPSDSSPLLYSNRDLSISIKPASNKNCEKEANRLSVKTRTEQRKVLLDKYSNQNSNAYDDKQEETLNKEDTEESRLVMNNNYGDDSPTEDNKMASNRDAILQTSTFNIPMDCVEEEQNNQHRENKRPTT